MAARALAKAASTSSFEVTLTRQNTPPRSRATASPRSALRSKMATLTPCDAKRRAVASPSPDAPPVMTAEMVESSFMGLFLNGGFGCLPRPQQRPGDQHPHDLVRATVDAADAGVAVHA